LLLVTWCMTRWRAEELSGEASIEVFDPRSVYPFDWNGLARSSGPAVLSSMIRTGRVVLVGRSRDAAEEMA